MKRFKLITAAAVLLCLIAFINCRHEGSSSSGGRGYNSSASSWNICYHPCYQWYLSGGAGLMEIPWDKITHLVPGYMLPYQNSAGKWDIKVPVGFFPGQTEWFRICGVWAGEAHSYNRKVLCHLGGAGSNIGDNAGFWNNATSAANVGDFAANIKARLKPVGFDGVNINWEDGVIDYSGILRLVIELRSIWPDAVITAAAGSTGDDALSLAPCNPYMDAFMPMSYMSIQQWGGWILPVPPTPLYAYGNNPYSIELILNKWITAGVPAKKVMLGVGGAGQAWTDSNDDDKAPNVPYCSTLSSNPEGEPFATFGDNVLSRAWLTRTLANHSDLTEHWDNVGKCSYWGAPAPDDLVENVEMRSGQFVDLGLVFHESDRAIECKLDFIDENSMKGIFFWTLRMLRDTDGTFPVLSKIEELNSN